MNTPSPSPAPENATPAPVPAVTPKPKFSGNAEKKHNRDVGHFVKSMSQHRPSAMRSMSHSRGR